MLGKLNDHIEVDSAVLAEDVREELNNKHSAIGIIIGDMMVPSFPQNLRIAAYFVLKSDKSGQWPLHFRVKYGDQPPSESAGTLVFATSGYSTIVVPMGLIAVAGPGRLVFWLSTDQKNWVEVISRNVSQGAPPLRG